MVHGVLEVPNGSRLHGRLDVPDGLRVHGGLDRDTVSARLRYPTLQGTSSLLIGSPLFTLPRGIHLKETIMTCWPRVQFLISILVVSCFF